MTNLVSPSGSFACSYNFQPASALVSSIGLPNGAGITNSYDSVARLTQTTLNNHWGHILDGYTYTPDTLGLRTNIVRNLGLTSSSVNVGYDSIGQLASWIAKETNGSVRLNEQFGFGFDSAYNLHTRTNGELAQTFNANVDNELTNVTRLGTFTLSGSTPAPTTNITVNGQAAQTYGDFTFASTNNSLANGTNTFAIIAQNVYGVTVTNNLALNLPSNVSLNYDNNGNLTNDGTRVFSYDSENQLTNVMVAGQWRSSFVYDGLSRRRILRDYAWQSGAWVLTNEAHYVYDGHVILQERDTNSNPLVTYTRGLDLSASLQGAGGIGGLLARTDTNGSTFYHADGAGNVTALMDVSENIVARYLYNPFGKLLGQWGSLATANTMQFSSMPQHDGLALYSFRAYEPNFQRWLSRDPLGERSDVNLYRFVYNSPLIYTDPNGLWGIAFGNNNGSSYINIGWGSPSLYFSPGSVNDAGQGAAAFADGINPFGNPFANNGFYDPCDGALQASKAIGTATGIIDASLLVGAGAFWAPGTSIFYSGEGALATATSLAEAGEGTTIANTLGGGLLNSLGIQSQAVWDTASWLYANATGSEVIVVLGEGGGTAATTLGGVEAPVLAARGVAVLTW